MKNNTNTHDSHPEICNDCTDVAVAQLTNKQTLRDLVAAAFVVSLVANAAIFSTWLVTQLR